MSSLPKTELNSERPSEWSLLRLLTCGSVDDGKSTLIGRLLFDCQQIPEDQLATLRRDSERLGTRGKELDYALLVDGLEAEREQGITIDVAYRYFRSSRRVFIIADTPGHEQYTRNMVTGASNADVAILLVDARKGLLTQTKRHSRICSLLGIKHVVLAINKMDLVGYAQERFQEIVQHFSEFSRGLSFENMQTIPVVAVDGDNIVHRSERMAWYKEPTILQYLERVQPQRALRRQPLRFLVQLVLRPDQSFRGLAGPLLSGRLRCGDHVVSATTGRATAIAKILRSGREVTSATAGDALTVVLKDELDVARGDLLVPPDHPIGVTDQMAATLVWMSEQAMLPGRSYIMRIGAQEIPASVTRIRHIIDPDTGEHLSGRELHLNQIGACQVSTLAPVPCDPYEDNRLTGSFILIDRASKETIGAGMVEFALRRAANLHSQSLVVSKESRAALNAQKPAILWFTGLSGAGKSTIANLLEQRLHAKGVHTYLLDGDNIRLGVNRDLGFTDADRVENIRRAGEIAKLFVDAGIVVLCAFISPFAAERDAIRAKMAQGEFVEIFVDAPLEICLQRDPKGLYAKAQAGGIANFTGLGSGYEPPIAPELVLKTAETSAEYLADQALLWLIQRGYIRG
jgi:bifunctional enzyme CysN/CysC